MLPPGARERKTAMTTQTRTTKQLSGFSLYVGRFDPELNNDRTRKQLSGFSVFFLDTEFNNDSKVILLFFKEPIS